MNILDELVSTYRGWDQMEKKFEPQSASIIDFDLSPKNNLSTEFFNRSEVLTKLQELRDSIKEDSSFLKARVDASLFYIRTLMGQQFSFDEYISHTMGIEPRFFTEERIINQRKKVEILLEKSGIKFERQYSDKVEEKLRLTEINDIKHRLLVAKREALERLQQILNLPKVSTIKIEFIQIDAYWQNWIKGTYDDGIKLFVNLHPRIKHLEGDPELLAYHEVCGHAVQMSMWLHRIKLGDLHPFYGITTVHSPEQFISEGLAQTITDILFEDGDLPYVLVRARELSRYRQFIFNNAHILINKGEPVDVVREYIMDNLPFESIISLEAEIRDRSYHPLFRTYQYVYAISDLFFLENIVTLPSNKKIDILKNLYQEPLTVQSLQSLLNGNNSNQL